MSYLGNLLPVNVFPNTSDTRNHLQLHYPGEPVPEVLVEDEHIDFDFDLKKCRNSTCRTCIAIRYSDWAKNQTSPSSYSHQSEMAMDMAMDLTERANLLLGTSWIGRDREDTYVFLFHEEMHLHIIVHLKIFTL